MNEKTKRFLALLTLLMFSLFLYVAPLLVSASTSTTLAFPSTVKWMLRNYNTTISFSETVYCTSFGYEGGTWTNTKWIWYNVKMDGETLSEWWITAVKANVTVNRLFADKVLKLTLTGDTGDTYTVTFSLGDFGKPSTVLKNGYEVEELKGWSVSGQNLTLTGTFQSTDVWEIKWVETSGDEGSGTSGAYTPSPSPPYIPTPPPPPTPVQPQVPLMPVGLLIIGASILGLYIYQEYSRQARLSRARKAWRKKSSRPRWKRRREFD